MSSTRRPAAVRAALGLAVALIALAAAETVAWIVDVAGGPDWRVDPLPSHEPYDVLCGDGALVRLCPDRGPDYERVRPVVAFREPLQPRVVVVGESFVYGLGLAADDAWPARLAHHLGGRAEVLNLGRCGTYAGRLLPVVDAALALQPSVLVLAVGNNEHTMTTFYAGWAGRHPLAVYRATALLGRSRLYGLLHRALAGGEGVHEGFVYDVREFDREVDRRVYAARRRPPDLTAFEDRLAGREVTRALEREQRLKERIFAGHLATMVERAGEAGVPVALATLPWSLTAEPELSGTHRGDEAAIRALLRELHGEASAPPDELVARALALDDRVARFHHEHGRLLLEAGDREGAAAALRRAAEWDLIPDATPSINRIVREVADEHGATLIELAALADEVIGQPAGFYLDKVHLDAGGCDRVGAEVAAAIGPLLEPAADSSGAGAERGE